MGEWGLQTWELEWSGIAWAYWCQVLILTLQ